MAAGRLQVVDLGRLSYEAAYRRQCQCVEQLLAARQAGQPRIGTILLVEHDPVITVSRRPGAMQHLLASPEMLARAGVSLARTDRGGDVTYHGPGQIVAYPILDLNHLGLRLHLYLRLLEQAVMDTCARYGVATVRDPCATGVWTAAADGTPHAKIAALGIRVRRWITMHGLALNVTTRLEHFQLIVPCGLVGRPVTSLHNELGPRCPDVDQVKQTLTGALVALLAQTGPRAAESPLPPPGDTTEAGVTNPRS